MEHLLGRDLLHLACRHHTLELVAGSAFTEVMGASSAHEVLLFERFQAQAHWQYINEAQFEASSTEADRRCTCRFKNKIWKPSRRQQQHTFCSFWVPETFKIGTKR